MARIYQEPNYNNQFVSAAQSGQFIVEKSFDPSKSIREDAKRKAENIKTLARNQQRQAAVDDANLNALATKSNADFKKAQMLLSLSATGLQTLQKIQEIKDVENEKQEGFDFLKGEYDASIFSSETLEDNNELIETAEYEQDLTIDASNNTEIAAETTDNKLDQELVIQEIANNEALRSIAATDTYTATASIGNDLRSFLDSDVKIQLSDGRIIIAREATLEELPVVLDVGLEYITKQYFGNDLSADKLLKNFIPTARAVYAELLETRSQEIIALNQEQRILEHIDLATAQLDGGELTQVVFDELIPKLYSTGAYKDKNEAFEAAFEHIANYYRANQDISGAYALLDIYKIRNDDGSYNTGSQLENDNKWNVKVTELISQIDNDIKIHRQAQINQLEDKMMEELSGLDNIEDRIDKVNEYVDEYNELGFHEEARDLQEKIEKLQVPDSQLIEDDYVINQVKNGEITDTDLLKDLYHEGVISKDGYDNAVNALLSINPEIEDEDIQEMVDGWIAGDIDDFKILIGAKPNELGILQFANDIGYLENTRDRARLIEALELDLKKVALHAYKLNIGSENVGQKIYEAINEWYQAQVLNEEGKYGVQPYGELGRSLEDKTNGTNKLLDLLGNSDLLFRSYVGVDTNVKPVDFNFASGTEFTDEIIANFNYLRGDTIFNIELQKEFVNQYQETGIFSEDIISAATALNMTPLQFLNHQNTAHGLDQVYRQSTLEEGTPNHMASTNVLLNEDLSYTSASLFAGNIEEYGSWNPINFSNVTLPFPTENTEEYLQVISSLALIPEISSIIKNPYATDRQILGLTNFLFVDEFEFTAQE